MDRPRSHLPFVKCRFLSLTLALACVSSARAVTVTVTTPADFGGGTFYACEPAGAGAGGVLRLRTARDFPAAACAPAPYVWCILGTMPAKREGHAAVVVGDRIYVVGGYEVPGYAAVPSVYFAPLAGVAAGSAVWTKASFEYAQTAGAAKGIAIRDHRAVAVGGRIYSVGGQAGSPGTPTGAVYSAPVDAVTGEPGPWRVEPPLPIALYGHGLVHARGALFSLGGINAAGAAVRFVHRAEIAPDGTLSPWVGVADLPVRPCLTGGTAPACCIDTTCQGWSWISAAAAGRSVMFFGGNLDASGVPDSQQIDFKSYAGELDDWNGLGGWQQVESSPTYALWDYQAVVVDGLAVTVGGNNAMSASNAVSWSVAGLDRDAGSPDRTRLLPPSAGSGGTRLFSVLFPAAFPMTATRHQLFAWQDGLFILGGSLAMGTDDRILRAGLVPKAETVNAGSFVSSPIDLGQPCILRRVAWTVDKHGGADDDWALVQYRVADESGVWSEWSPRIPEAGATPAAAGLLAYASDAAGALRVPLFPERVRWVQFAVVLYNDPASPGDPEFDDFTIVADPAPPPRPLRAALEAYPLPARDILTVRFQTVEGGAIVALRAFNAAAELVYDRKGDCPAGGIQELSVAVRDFSPGAYILRLTAESHAGGPGLVFGHRAVGTAEARIVVRR